MRRAPQLAACLNPWHYERTDAFLCRPVRPVRPDHHHRCARRLRISSAAAAFVCPRCNSVWDVLWQREDGSAPAGEDVFVKEEMLGEDGEGSLEIFVEEGGTAESCEGGVASGDVNRSLEDMIGSYERKMLMEMQAEQS